MSEEKQEEKKVVKKKVVKKKPVEVEPKEKLYIGLCPKTGKKLYKEI